MAALVTAAGQGKQQLYDLAPGRASSRVNSDGGCARLHAPRSLLRRALLGFPSQSRSGGEQAVHTNTRAEGLSERVGRGYAHARDEEGSRSAHADLAAAPFLADRSCSLTSKDVNGRRANPSACAAELASYYTIDHSTPARGGLLLYARGCDSPIVVERRDANAQGNSRSLEKSKDFFVALPK